MSLEILSFRQVMLDRLPPWLSRHKGTAERYFYAMAIVLDAIGEALVAGVKARFPGYYTFESLPYIGRDRMMPRYLGETDAQYAERLRGWLDYHRQRGLPVPMLQELRRLLLSEETPPATVRARLVYRSGAWFEMAADGTITTGTGAWDWDPYPEQWSRAWLILYRSDWTDNNKWGDAWDPNYDASLGSTAQYPQIQALRAFLQDWTPAHASIPDVIIVRDAAHWGDVVPSNWHLWSNRDTRFAYFDGS